MTSDFAAFMRVKEGGYTVGFPDILEAFAQGSTYRECLIVWADILAVEERAEECKKYTQE